MTALLVRRSTLPQLFSGHDVILVEDALWGLVPDHAASHFTLVPFTALTVGDGTDDAVPLESVGLPTGVRLIVERAGSRLGSAWLEFSRQCGHPSPPAKLSIMGASLSPGRARSRIERSIAESFSLSLADLTGSLVDREKEIAALRLLLEQRDLKLDRMKNLLGMVGLAHDELVFDSFVDPAGGSVSLPASQSVGLALRGVRAISVYKTSPAPAAISVSITSGDRMLFSGVAEGGDGSSWVDVFLPDSLIAEVQDAQISFTGISADVDLLGLAGSHQVFVRLWRDKAAASPPPAMPAARLLPPLGGAQHRLLIADGETGPDQEERPDAAAPPDYASFALHGSQPVHFAVRGVVLRAGETITVPGQAPATNHSAVECAVMVLPHGREPSPELREALKSTTPGSWPASGERKPVAAGEAFTLSHGVTAPESGRYDIVVMARNAASAPAAHNRVLWGQPAITGGQPAAPRAFASANLASLHSLISFCDGPLAETKLNSTLGYPVIAASDGQRYLQTHPVLGCVVGARLPHLVPAGTERMWLHLSNDHPLGAETECIAAVVPGLLDEPVEAWLARIDLGSYRGGLAVTDLAGGGLVARVQVRPASAFTMDIGFIQPTDVPCTLYLLVRALGASVSYGWCRWHLLGLAFDSSTQPLPITP